MKLKLVLLFFVLLILQSCSSGIPCLDDNIKVKGEIVFENRWAKDNGGIRVWKSTDTIVTNQVCELFATLEKANRVYVREHHWRIDIFYNESDYFFRNSIKLFYTLNDGYVFERNHYFYRSDGLVSFVLDKVRVPRESTKSD